MMNRRNFLNSTVLATTGAMLLRAENSLAHVMNEDQFTLPSLTYSFDAFDTVIDAQTMQIHHGKHHASYVANLNKAVAGLQMPNSLAELMTRIHTLPEEKKSVIRNNGGGHYNHTLFWTLLAPQTQVGKPSAELQQAIQSTFGSIDTMMEQFNSAAISRFGSGWAWLYKKNNRLYIGSTANQDNPLMDESLSGINGKPILCLDVWEHAYYLKYQNRRADYVKAWWNIVNWNTVNSLFSE